VSRHPNNKSWENEGLKIAKLLSRGGFQAFFVGGTVRDMLLGRQLHDLDIATSAPPDKTEKILGKGGYSTKAYGKGYGTIMAVAKPGPIEITTFRKEGRYVNRRRPETVTYVGDYAEDSRRRDFTINSMYMDPQSGEILDPQLGQRDIKRKLVKFVGDPRKRIDEDALRMLRAVRLAMQLGFALERNSFAAIKTRAKYIQQITGERIKAELDKMLALPDKEAAVRLLDRAGLLRFVMPEVYALKKISHKSRTYHLEGSVFEHTMLVLKNVRPGDVRMGYAALYHDTGKALTATPREKPEGLVNSFPNHEFVSAELFGKFAQRMRFGAQDRDFILWITKMHMKQFVFSKGMSQDKKVELATHKLFPELIEFWRADQAGKLVMHEGKVVPAKSTARAEALKLLAKINSKKKILDQVADGDLVMREAGLSEGRRVGEIKNVLATKIVYGEIKNLLDAKKFLNALRKNT
jgi:tRNA nucleotidyltransferase/poly(A) polymerase